MWGWGGGSHPFLPHPAQETQNNVFLQCSRNHFHLRFCKVVNKANFRGPSHLIHLLNNNSVRYTLYSTVNPSETLPNTTIVDLTFRRTSQKTSRSLAFFQPLVGNFKLNYTTTDRLLRSLYKLCNCPFK